MKAIAYRCLWLTALFFSKELFAQRLIPRLGLTGSMVSYSDFYDKDIRLGYSVNIGYEIALKGNLYLQPDIGFVSKGSNYTLQQQDQSLTIYYAEVAVPAKYFLGHSSKVSILFGPTVGIGLGGRLRIYGPPDDTFKIGFDGYPVDGYDVANQSYLDNRFDFGLQVGTGIELWKKIALDIRYTHGFIRLYNDFTLRGDFYNEPIKNARNRSFQFSVGIPFKVGKSLQ